MNWSLPFLTEELWLRIRRNVIAVLDGMVMVPSESKYRNYMTAQDRLGRYLLDQLASSFGEKAYLQLTSERFAGPDNSRFLQRLPITLAFGYQGCVCFQQVSTRREQTEGWDPAAEASALFNLAAVVVDLIVDRMGQTQALTDWLTEEQLERCWQSRDEASRLLSMVPDAPADLAVLAGSLQAFFSRVHAIHDSVGPCAAWATAGKTVMEAYAAEMSSLQEAATSDQAKTMGNAKSQAPLLLFAQLARLSAGNGPHVADGSGSDNAAVGDTVVRLAAEIGHAIGIVDDLVDVIPDLSVGNLNRVLVEIGVRPRPVAIEEQKFILSRILEGQVIEELALEVGSHLRNVVSTLEDLDLPPEIQSNVVDWISIYLVDWLQS